jgi:hypothetical protein
MDAVSDAILESRSMLSLPCLAAALALFCMPARGQPQAPDGGNGEALAAYQLGVEAAKKDQWQEALGHFLEAAKLGAPVVVHYNIGRCLEALGRYEEAAASYGTYAADPSASDVDAVNQKIEELRLKPLTVSIESTPSGAVVLRQEKKDAVVVGKTPCVIGLPAGKSTLIVRKAGHADAVLSVESWFGKSLSLEARLEKETAPKPAAAAAAAGDGTAPSSAGAAPPRGPARVVLEAGGGLSLPFFKDVAFSAGGSFSIDAHKIFGRGWVQYAAGLQLGGMYYRMASSSGKDYGTMFIDALVFVHLRLSVHPRVVILVSLPVGASFLTPAEDIPKGEALVLLGGRIAGGGLPFFSVGLGLALRINLVSRFHLIARPADILLLVPMRKLYGDNAVLPRFSLQLLLGWEF